MVPGSSPGGPTIHAQVTPKTAPYGAAALAILRTFSTVALPLARPGLITGAVLGFAHTVGEFGVVLLIGGNIPGETRVLSVAIYDHAEALEYAQAHWLSAGLLAFSFLVVWLMFRAERRLSRDRHGD